MEGTKVLNTTYHSEAQVVPGPGTAVQDYIAGDYDSQFSGWDGDLVAG